MDKQVPFVILRKLLKLKYNKYIRTTSFSSIRHGFSSPARILFYPDSSILTMSWPYNFSFWVVCSFAGIVSQGLPKLLKLCPKLDQIRSDGKSSWLFVDSFPKFKKFPQSLAAF